MLEIKRSNFFQEFPKMQLRHFLLKSNVFQNKYPKSLANIKAAKEETVSKSISNIAQSCQTGCKSRLFVEVNFHESVRWSAPQVSRPERMSKWQTNEKISSHLPSHHNLLECQKGLQIFISLSLSLSYFWQLSVLHLTQVKYYVGTDRHSLPTRARTLLFIDEHAVAAAMAVHCDLNSLWSLSLDFQHSTATNWSK